MALSALLTVTLLPSAPAWAVPPDEPRSGPDLVDLQQDAKAELDEEGAAALGEWAGTLEPQPEYVPTQVDVPEGGTASVPLDSAGEELVQAGDLPVSIGKASPTPEDPDPPEPSGTWDVAVEPRATTEGAGVDGALITVTPPTSGTAPVDVELDYSQFEDLYGTEWASRLKLVQLPRCFLDSPELPECTEAVEVPSSNDPAEGTVRATADPAAAETAGVSTQSGGGPVVMAATDGASGAGGTYTATDLSPSGSWTAGGSGGGFTWSYPLGTPPAPAGPKPEIALSYSSQAVDGKTSVANGQASWVGDGWNYHPGFVERRYRSCSQDRKGTPNNDTAEHKKKSDLCWAGDHVVLSIGGTTTELVHDDDTGAWIPAADNGLRVQHKKDTALGNGDNDGEYWIVTDRSGARYFFGKNKVGGGRPDTRSTFTVPVFGNHAGEPCHAAGYADSSCTQAWRWNLDLVQDVHGNAMVVDWARETNHYARNGKFKDHVSYVRGGHPKKIEYGLRAGNLDGPPAARVVFSVRERCIQQGEVACSDAEFTSENYGEQQPWWDTPSTLHCAADDENCYVSAPTFWTRKRLSAVTTYAPRSKGSTALSKVDRWTLEHSFPKQRTDTHPPLWLESVTRTGYGPDGDGTTLPPVTFLPNVDDMPNRVARSATDPTPDFDRLRVATIRTETGGEIQVEYSQPCALGASPEPADNGTRCFPVHWSPDPELEEPDIEWFNKYVVTKVVEKDRVARQPDVVTTYTYEDDAAWAKSTDEFTKPALRTYSQWRGYASVLVKKGTTAHTGDHDATVQTQTRTRYFRGMSGDAGRAVITVEDSTGQQIAEDLPPYQGRAYEQLVYDKAGGTVEARTVTRPWAQQTAARARDGLPDLKAWRSGTKRTDAVQSISGDRTRTVRTVHTVDDTYGLTETTERLTLTPDGSGGHTTGDEQCTAYSYAHHTGTHLIGLVSRERVTAGTCAEAAAATGADVVSDRRTSYDALDAFGQQPTKGLPRQVDTVQGDGSGWVTSSRTTFDALGRVRTVTDAQGNETTTSYTPDTGAVFTSETTNPAGHTSTTTVDPGRGLPLTETDANDRTVTTEYDDLGRSTAVWSPSQDPAGDKPKVRFSYQVREDAPTAVTTRTLRDNGSYDDSIVLYDGLLRERQTQREALGGGRILTDTRYNTLGQVAAVNNDYLAKGEPEKKLFVPESVFQVPNSTETAYDGMGRPVKTTTLHEGEPDHSTVTSYGGDWTQVWQGKTADGSSTRRGSQAKKTWTDVLGRTSRIQHFTTRTLSESTDTHYAYDHRGNLTEVTDHKGNAWTYTYDARGRLTDSTDPDMGDSHFTYDVLDRQVTATDSRGRTRHTTYDVLGRKTELRKDDAGGELVAEWTYDTLPGAKGLPVSATRYTDGAAYTTATTGYDAEYRPTGSRVTIPETEATEGLAGTYSYRQSYTATGKPQSITLPATPGGLPEEKVITRYGSEGQPLTTSGHDWYTADTLYSPFGEVLRTVSGEAPHRVWSTSEYDPHTGRLDRTVTDREKAGPHRLTNVWYGYDIAGNVTWITDIRANGTRDRQCFSYDPLNRLRHAWTGGTGGCPRQTSARDSGPEPGDVTAGPDGDGYWRSYTYDAVGNRTRMVEHDLADPALDDTYTYTYGSTVTGNGTSAPEEVQPHTLTRVDAVEKTATGTIESFQSYGYDNLGNTTERMIDGDTQKLTWNTGNKLTSVDVTDNGLTDVSYLYDADGNRLIEKTQTGATLFLGETEVSVDVNGQPVDARRYYSHPGAPTVLRTTGGSGDLDEHTLTVLLSDHHGTATTAVSLDAAMGVQRRKFGPFGTPRGQEPGQWPGRRSFLGTGIDDPITGLTHIGAREYDPTTGRFLSADPVIDITDPMQMHGYAYANNNPVTLSDPTGLCPFIDCPTRPSPHHENTTPGHEPGPPKLTPSGEAWMAQQIKKIATGGSSGGRGRTSGGGKGGGNPNDKYNDFNNCSPKFGACATVNQGEGKQSAGQFFLSVVVPDFQAWEDCLARGEAAGCANAALDLVKPAKLPKKLGKYIWKCLKKNSFLAGTEILLADGTTKPIEELEPGDEVLATDPETGETVAETVTAAIYTKDDKQYVDLTVTDRDGTGESDVLTTTAHHPFWSESEQQWLDAGDLKPGMTLRTDDGTTATVHTTRTHTAHHDTYNLTVHDLHTYYVLAGGTSVLVHNSGGESRFKYLDRSGYSNYVLVDRGGTVYYSGMFGPGDTPAGVQYRHRNNNNRFNPANGDKMLVMPGTRTYGESRLMEQRISEQHGTYIGRDGNNYRGNRQNPLAGDKLAEYEAYEARKLGGCP